MSRIHAILLHTGRVSNYGKPCENGGPARDSDINRGCNVRGEAALDNHLLPPPAPPEFLNKERIRKHAYIHR